TAPMPPTVAANHGPDKAAQKPRTDTARRTPTRGGEMGKTYVFADEQPGTRTHAQMVRHLAAPLDPFTRRRHTPLIHPGTECLEIGAGAGTIALWMAHRGGKVTATDLEPEHIPEHPGITPLRHDITTDPLDEGRWQLIHARLVLAHLPGRVQIVEK